MKWIFYSGNIPIYPSAHNKTNFYSKLNKTQYLHNFRVIRQKYPFVTTYSLTSSLSFSFERDFLLSLLSLDLISEKISPQSFSLSSHDKYFWKEPGNLGYGAIPQLASSIYS